MQGFALGDGWIHNKLNRFKIHVYDSDFQQRVHGIADTVKVRYGLTSSEFVRRDRLMGTREWAIELGGAFAVQNLNLSLLSSSEGLYFLAGLWDADGGWYLPDESHPLGQAKFFGGWHTVYKVKRGLKDNWHVASGRMFVSTPEGQVSRIGNHAIVTRSNVYGITIRAKSMGSWVELIGLKMLLKNRLTRQLLSRFGQTAEK